MLRFVAPTLALIAAASSLPARIAAGQAPATPAPPPAQAVTVDSAPVGAPVVIRRDTLFYLYGRIGGFTAAERAAGVVRRAAELAGGVAAGTDSIVIAPGETHTDLLVGETVLMTVLEADARPVGAARSEVAQRYAERLTAAMRLATRQATLRTIAVGALLTLLVTAVVIGLLKLMAIGFPRLVATLERWRGTRIPALRLQRLELLSAARVTDGLILVVRAVRVVLVVVLLYFSIPLILNFFPWTKGLATRIVGYVLGPLAGAGRGFVGYLPNVFFIAVTAVLTRYALKIVRMIFDAIQTGAVVIHGFYREWADPTYKIVRFMILAFVVVIVFPYLPGAGSDAFKGVSLFLGALFTLGSSSAIANVVAGTVLTYTRAFQLGDRVRIGETTGDVIEKTLLATRVRTIKNEDITIPNAMVLSSHITNYSTMATKGGVILHTSVTIGYDTPWRQVHELLLAAAAATDGVLAEPAPFVLQTSLDDFYVSYQINASTDRPAVMARTYSLLHQQIQDKFFEAGVEIMSPHQAALRDGNAPALPAAQRPPGRSPAFRVDVNPT